MTTGPATSILMIRPARFGYNPETATSNVFQRRDAATDEVVVARARGEFEALATALDAAGVDVIIVDDTETPVTPDAVFPNNWISFHRCGTVVLYPMESPTRRLEVRPELVDVVRRAGFRAGDVVDRSQEAAAGRFLEGTGSLVFDDRTMTAYACRSARTDANLVREICEQLGYEAVLFDAESGGRAIYHTNVLLSIGARFAVLCKEVIRDERQRSEVASRLAAPGREIIEIDETEMAAFAANVLELGSRSGGAVLAMSAAAASAYKSSQRATLARCGEIVATPLTTIETSGGGSARCMIAEVFLPRG